MGIYLKSTVSKRTPWRFLEPLTDSCRVLFAGTHFHAGLPFVRQELDSRKIPHQIELIHAPTEQELFRLAPQAHVALPFMEKFSAAFFHPETTPNLRLSIQYGVGLEQVDIESATKAGVAVSNIPADGTGNAQATSEHAIFLSISLLRHALHELPKRFQEKSLGGLPVPQSLYKKRVTLVGSGAVGTVLCRYLLVMGANVTVVRKQCWSTFVDSSEDVHFNKASSLEETLPTTDLLILACAMTPDTLHMINGKTISLLPRGALLVNVGRGALVEHDAVLRAIQSGAVGGFASDVGVGHPSKPSEPWDPNDELSKHPNTLFTPHVGGYTDYSYGIMANKIVDAIECVIRGDPPPVFVNNDGIP
jgi:phosphoglycerate dehydrogenase-like enzyme